MKILIISQRFFPAIGGAELLLKQLANFLAEKNDVTVYTTNAIDLDSFWNPEAKTLTEGLTRNDNYTIKRFKILTPSEVTRDLIKFPFSTGIPGPFAPSMWDDLLESGKNFDLMIVSAFPYNHVIPAFFISNLYKIPIITIPHIHLEFPELYFTGLRLALLNRSDAIVVNTSVEKNAIVEHGIPIEKIHVIHPTIDFSSWINMDEQKRSQLIRKSEMIKILFAGNKSPEKGIINLIEAMKKLWEKNLSVELVTIGSTTSIYDEYLKNQTKETKFRIHDLGIVSDEEKKILFYSCDIVALPSKTESFGLTYLEGWACKKPVVGCNIRAVSEVVDNAVNGLLVDFGDIDQLSVVLERLVKDEKLRQSLGNNGNEKLIQKYDAKTSFLKFEEVCLSLK